MDGVARDAADGSKLSFAKIYALERRVRSARGERSRRRSQRAAAYRDQGGLHHRRLAAALAARWVASDYRRATASPMAPEVKKPLLEDLAQGLPPAPCRPSAYSDGVDGEASSGPVMRPGGLVRSRCRTWPRQRAVPGYGGGGCRRPRPAASQSDTAGCSPYEAGPRRGDHRVNVILGGSVSHRAPASAIGLHRADDRLRQS